MSYILDALRRADAERDRGQIPGLNAQPGPAAMSAEPRRPGMLALGLGAGLVLVLAAALAWWLWPRAAAPTPVVVQTVQPPVLPAPPPAPAATPAPAVVPAPAPLPVVVSAPPPVAPAAPAARPAAAAASAPPTLTLAELTPEQRRDWPPLQIGGVVHSDHPASRFVIVNGQLVHEGEEAAPGVTVEHIGPRAAILRWRGLRVAMPF